MNPLAYALGRSACRFVGGMSVRHRFVHRDRLDRPGPYVLACTHIGHLEPMLLAAAMKRRVHWLAREEFFRQRWAAMILRRLGAIELDRFGTPVRALREAGRRLGRGQVVGIFPEGRRVHGDRAAVRGGPIKGGACTIAMRAGLPIVPVVMIGTDALAAVTPFLPGQRTTVRTIVGKPLLPPQFGSRAGRRERRRAMTEQLRQAFVDLHVELLEKGGPA